jgi:hypothetical protein
MRTQRKVGLFSGLVLLMFSLGTTAGVAGTSTTAMVTMRAADRPALVHVHTFTTRGTRGPSGGCTFGVPKLTLAPNQTSVEVDQIGIEAATCQAKWQMGTPVAAAHPTSHARSISAPAGGANVSRGPATRTLYSGSGYYKGWITDVANITLTSDQSNLSWSYNNTCAKSVAGGAEWTYHGSTGWNPPYNNDAKKYLVCDHAEVTSDATFNNTGFCWPITTYNTYKNINVFGGHKGSLYNDGTSVISYSGACAPLYIHSKLQRTA